MGRPALCVSGCRVYTPRMPLNVRPCRATRPTRSGRVLALAGLIAAGGCAVFRPAAHATRARDFRVLVLNMHAGADAAGHSNLDSVAALVRRVRADVVLLQEVDSVTQRSGRVDQLAALRRRTGYHGAFGRSLDFQGGGYGIAVLARAPIAAARTVRLPVAPPQERAGGSYEPRVALHAAVALGGRDTLHLLNTHLDPSRDDGYRRQEAATLVAEAARLARRAPLVLVGGDMNSTPESEVQAAVRRAGWRDLWSECGEGAGLTYPAEAPVKRIDYLYAIGRASCVRGEVLTSRASDHRGVLFTLRRPAARGGA